MQKRHWKTTVAGIVAAVGTALSSTAVLPHPWSVIVGAITAAALAILGGTAADKKVVNGSLNGRK